MWYREYDPPVALAPFVRCFWALEAPAAALDAPTVEAEPVLPDGCMEMVVHYGDRYRIDRGDGTYRRQPSSLILGQLIEAIRLEPSGVSGMVAARFRPNGAAPFLRADAATFTAGSAALDSLFGAAADRLSERIGEAATLGERMRHLENFFLDRLENVSDGRTKTPDVLATRAVDRIEASQGCISMDAVLAESSVGARQLERCFRREVGMTPKRFARIVRFQAAVRLAERSPSMTLASVAHAAGYFDQSHFNRDFRAFAGQSPAAFFGETHRLSQALTGAAGDDGSDAGVASP